MMKPSDLSPLFSDEDATPEEIARARRIAARVQLQEIVKEYRELKHDIDNEIPDDLILLAKRGEYEAMIIALALELFPE